MTAAGLNRQTKLAWEKKRPAEVAPFSRHLAAWMLTVEGSSVEFARRFCFVRDQAPQLASRDRTHNQAPVNQIGRGAS
jgi:hypothetical protein